MNDQLRLHSNWNRDYVDLNNAKDYADSALIPNAPKPLYENTIRDLTNDGCGVCAKGALLVGYLLRSGVPDVPVGDIHGPMSEVRNLFGSVEFDRIEGCFEGDGNAVARAYRVTYPRDNDRLEAVLENIIRNRGEFKPEQDVEVLRA